MLTALSQKRLIRPGVCTLAGLGVLVSLGAWQLKRLAWKEGLIAAIAARTTGAPVSLAEANARLQEGGDVEYLRVRVRGSFLHDRERYLYAPDPVLGAGYHVYTPFQVEGGLGVLFVNRGFVPEALKEREARMAGQREGVIEVIGLLRAPETKGFFTPDNNPGANLWYWRDFEGLFSSAFGDREQANIPMFVDTESAAPGGWPRGGATRLDLPNRHLVYALTWFALAAALAAVFCVYAFTRSE